jgi:uncharacterized peroxidase-related enzyme
MAFVDERPDAELYEEEREKRGYLPNFVRALSQRSDVYRAWMQLNKTILGGMDERRYELATLAAARRLRSSYCSLAHGKVLADKFFDPDEVRRLPEGLDEVDVAVMELAEQIAVDATSVEQSDIDRLRTLGLTDEEIVSVVVAAAARCFFSKTLDALGAEPDALFHALDPQLRDALTVGRPIEQLSA